MPEAIETCARNLMECTTALAEKDGRASASDVLDIEGKAWDLAFRLREYGDGRQDNKPPPEETRQRALHAFQEAGDTLAKLQERHKTLAPECCRARKTLQEFEKILVRWRSRRQ